ncbi:DUF6399 domain-containing protein [Floridanema evergladense]|uniref:DUF6399 domain-containing protein n=1 Tax=Floridaenema evergladense BLCC-F167 TaxID=3153639 RepID=A0ABV4WRP5_9CYAN
MNVRVRGFELFKAGLINGLKSIRSLADSTQISKSSVHRHQQAMKRRNLHPESHLWETPAGYQWLRLLVFATLYIFGIQQGVGCEVISRFFHLLRLQNVIGVSPTSLRRIEAQMREQILNYSSQIQQQLKNNPTTLEIRAGADETFFPEVVLVLMDLVSGYIILEDFSQDRQYLTWSQKAEKALQNLGGMVVVKSLVSDRAKALIQLAVQGFDCASIPDLFHAMRGISKVVGSCFGSRLNHLKKQLRTLHSQVLNSTQKRQPIPERLSQQIAVLQEEYNFFLTGQQAYHHILHQITCTVHPFAIDGSGFQSTVDVATALYQLLPQLAAVGHTYQIAKLDKAIKAFSDQIAAMAAGINLWWQSVEESLLLEEIDVEMSDWLLKYFLPHFYWRSVIAQTKNPTLCQIYESTSIEALSRLLLHPLTSKLDRDEWAHWRDWATLMSAKFQRSSSAIEGRNGYLSRLHHCGRGISQQQLPVLTVIHNFDLKRTDGTTAAQRLFSQEFPDLFEWVIAQMGDLPLPRKSYSF